MVRTPRNWHVHHLEKRSFGAKVADNIAAGMGSWSFLIAQSVIVALWVGLNLAAYTYRWDPYPFILLNLLFSTQAAYAAPIILMSQNRQAERDRAQAEADYLTNLEAKEEIEELQRAIARIENEKLDKILAMLEKRK